MVKRIEAHKRLIAGICCPERKVNSDTLKKVISLAMEIAREGREGRKIGTLFVIGDTDATIKYSRPMILDPLYGHPDSKKRIDDPGMRETVKELAQLDGAFIVADDGIVLSAARYIDSTSDGIDLPLGLGSRHMAAASITKKTHAVAVVVSESSMVRVFDNGGIVGEIIPELWILKEYSTQFHESLLEELSAKDEAVTAN
ncbi:MAG: DNA integrity scanning protein DisA nucleotide-binding domain protein [Thermodesulfobacteriota bacterium]